jgi:hypothetical protein
MGRSRTFRPEPERSDVVGGLAVALLIAAALLPSARDVLFAGAICASAGWVAWDAISSGGPGPRARLVMALACAGLVALPAVLLVGDHGLWVGAFPGLTGGLLLWATGIFALAVASRFARPSTSPNGVGFSRAEVCDVRPAVQRFPIMFVVLAVLALVSFAAFVVKVGGPITYVRNLDKSGAATYGLTYLIWGTSFAKYGAFVHLGECWAQGRRPRWPAIAAAGAALALISFIGSRLLLLVSGVQLLLLYAALRPLGRRFKMALAASTAAGLIVFVCVGEFRTWESLGHVRSFPSYLANTGLPGLPRTFVNQYADGVRLSVTALHVVPSKAGYENGKEFLRVLLQPLPSAIRPAVSRSRALTAAFSSGHGNGNALPLPVEGYLQFGFVGALGLSLLLGVAVGLVDRIGTAARDVGWLAATVAAATGAVIVLRGSLAQGIALATIDVVGFFVAHRLLYRKGAAATSGSGENSGPRRAVPPSHLASQTR